MGRQTAIRVRLATSTTEDETLNKPNKLPIIGLTGGMGSGKSTVSRFLAVHGGCILDADAINHEQMRAGMPAYMSIVEAFGQNILDTDGEIARRALGAIVFQDESKLQKLVEITHKHVANATMQAIDALQKDNQNHRFIVIDAPLLIEANMHTICDAVWVVTANDGIRIARILERDGLTKEQALERIQKQIPQSTLAGYADCILQNNGDLKTLEIEIDKCLRQILEN